MCILQSIVQFVLLKGSEECAVVFELAPDGSPNDFRVAVLRLARGNQNMETMPAPTPLVMNDKILAIGRRPDEPFAWEGGIGDDVGHLPLLARLRESTVVIAAECDHGWGQVGGGVNLVEARSVLQDPAVLC